MSLINLFLQKRKMRESQYGFVMVLIAYALSVMMLFLGSDVFYNVNSAAAGISTTDEEASEEIKKELPVSQAADLTGLFLRSKKLHPFAITELSETGLGGMQEKEEMKGLLLKNTFIGAGMAELMEHTPELESVSSVVAAPEDIRTAVVAKDTKTEKEVKEEKEAKTDMKVKTEKKAEEEKKSAKDKKTDKEEIYSLSAASEKSAKSAYAYDVTKKEIGMLQRIVQAEAGGEDMIGKILVVNVIMNRIEDESFPDSVEKVIFQSRDGEYQFSPIGDKRYWSVKVSESTKEAVTRALEGEDYSKGALYFIARKRTKSSSAKWFDNHLKWLFKHGGHEFYKEK